MDRERGQATVELALCLPLVVACVAVVVQVGGIAMDGARLWHAAREAARTAAVAGDMEEIREAAGRAGVHPISVDVSPQGSARAMGAPVTVRVAHNPVADVPLIGRIFGDVELEARATYRIETP